MQDIKLGKWNQSTKGMHKDKICMEENNVNFILKGKRKLISSPCFRKEIF